jgi:hypothetical protein
MDGFWLLVILFFFVSFIWKTITAPARSTVLTSDYKHFREFQADYCAPQKRWFEMKHF